MKYKCKECGKIYRDKPKFCSCGSDNFITMRSKSEREAIVGSIKNAKIKKEKQAEKRKAPFLILFAILFFAGLYLAYDKIKFFQEQQPEINDAYLTEVRENMLKDFDPSGITNSGSCIISFKIRKDGTVYDKLMEQQSPIKFLNDRVMGMLIMTDSVEAPPKAYTDVPIKILFGCIAEETKTEEETVQTVDCYSKNIVEEKE